MNTPSNKENLTLVLGGTGKTGRRVVERLKARKRAVRIGARLAVPAFDWNNEAGWDAALRGVSAVCITYAAGLAMPGATHAIEALAHRAWRQGVGKLVLLSGRGEEEAQGAERIVQNAGLDWSIVRAGWANQNFSEDAFVDTVRGGAITLPAGDTPEPFVHVGDIADVAGAALTDDRHDGQVYEMTGPRLMTLADVPADLSPATGRAMAYQDVLHDAFVAEVSNSGAPREGVWILDYLFSTVLDGRNAHVTDGVERSLGRPAMDLADYARETASTGVWRVAA
jgi:uncharacterized protein YbjT (DUF2867 family)